jgi:hypothetical protein
MAYIRVHVVTPSGQSYSVEVNENTSSKVLLDALIKELGLPIATKDGSPVKYSLSLCNALRIQEGVTIEINRAEPPAGPWPYADMGPQVHTAPSISDSLEMGIQAFKSEHDPSKTVFVMMKFSGDDPGINDKLEGLFNTIKLALDKYDLDAVRADEKNYSATYYIWDNAQIYLNGCNYGIAVLENLYSDEMNPNVALEYGYMLAKGKQVLLLKEKSFKNIRADILGKIWKEFEIGKKGSIERAIQGWMVDLGSKQIKV